MEHETIAGELWPERYVAGRLTPAEAERFEEHFLNCAECLEELELARRLRQGLATVALEEGARVAVARAAGRGLLARLARSRAIPWVMTAAALLLFVPGISTIRRTRDLQGELERARKEIAARSAGDGQVVALRQELERERATAKQERERLSSQLAQAVAPQGNTLLLPLAAERSGGEGDPARQLFLPDKPEWVVLTLDLGPPDFPTYRAVLRRGNRKVWEGKGLQSTPAGQLAVSLHSSTLEPGDYTVEVGGAGKGGRVVPVARFAFRVEHGR